MPKGPSGQKRPADVNSERRHGDADYRFHPKEIIASGESVWGHFDVGLFFDPKIPDTPKKHITFEMMIFWRLKDGKTIEHQAFLDTAAMLIQQGSSLMPTPQA